MSNGIHPFILGVVIGACFIRLVWGATEAGRQVACQKKYDVYDCHLKPEPYEPSENSRSNDG